MDELITEIINRTTVQGQIINIVENPDGFLHRKDVQQAIMQQAEINVLEVSGLELRIAFEIDCKDSPNDRWLFIVKSIDDVLPDIRQACFLSVFNTKDLFVTYYSQGLDLSSLNYKTALQLFKNRSINIQDKVDTRLAVDSAQEQFGENGNNISIVKEKLSAVTIDWHKAKETIEQVSEYVIKAARQGKYEDIEDELLAINQSFQQYIDNKYFSQLQTATSPKVVHRILPYIVRQFGPRQKVALVVVDGMAYWQYLLLRNNLKKVGITTGDQVIYSWLPSITKLSRQAIFRGDRPILNYKQNPANEQKLWLDFWKLHGFTDIDIQYIYNREPDIEPTTKRLAFVTVEIDDAMHRAINMKQLCRDTDEWASTFASTLKSIHDAGFTILMTADHGSVFSHGWGNLSSKEKTYLYMDGSRGKRHSIYEQPFGLEYFLMHHEDIKESLLTHNDFICWRDNKCFGTDNCVTHGGSNMLEMLVPFITIH
jgi:hypothetical protein